MLKRILLATFVTLLLLSAMKYVESTQPGKDAEKYLFAQLQKLLPSYSEDLPILVVDLGKIPGGKDQATSRDALKRTLVAIVEQRPIAVGVDVDFSPDVSGWQVDTDPEFFDFCLQLKEESKVPIYLGVFRTMTEKPDTWLGSEKYKSLAAALHAEDDTMRLPQWIQAKNSVDKLPLMSAALAERYRASHSHGATALGRTVQVFTNKDEQIEARGENEMLFGVSLVNFSRLGQIQRETSLMPTPESIAKSDKMFSGKMVLIGDAADSFDHFNVPGRDPPIAGVFLIACAAYTLAVEPLYELSTATRVTLDLFISAIITAGMELVRLLYVRKRPGSRFYKAQGRFILAVVGVVIIVGLLMTVWLNIMWFDFPLVLAALLLHPRVEHQITQYWKKLRSTFTASLSTE